MPWILRGTALGTAALIFGIDRLSKMAILNFLHEGDSVSVTWFLNFTLAFNRGISFGLFYGGGIFITVLVVVIMGALLVWLWRLLPSQRGTGISIGIILGGAGGNLYDRIFYGGVVDFIDFHLYNFHWFVFNLADVAIFMGVALLFLRKQT